VSEAIIQYQDQSGNWIPCEVVPNEPPLITQGLQRAGDYHRGSRIRAVDSDGRLLDKL
jgi:hypothetical protein